jgi:hypothetical protein
MNFQHRTFNFECGAASYSALRATKGKSQTSFNRSFDSVPTRRDSAQDDRGKCEDCKYSVPAGGPEGPILTCRNKAVAPGRLWVVGAEECCANFTRDKELLAPELVQALAEGARLIPLTQGRFAIVDAEDYEELSQHKWHVMKCRRSEYAARYSTSRKHILMHRVLLNAPAGAVVDHRDVNGLNNRKSNLRLCTHQENNCNQRPRLGGTSRFKGVCRHKVIKKYVALIQKDGKRYSLGCYQDETEAAVVYDIKAMELFGEFAYLNFPKLMRRYKICNSAA